MASSRALELATGLGLTALLLVVRPAHAEPSAAQKETARSLMAEGRELREHQDLRGALERFRAADAIMGVPTTGFELARAQVDLGLLVEARATLRRVSMTPAQEGEPAPFREARDKAVALDAELEARVPSLTFVLEGLAPGDAVTVTVDGEPLASAALAQAYRVNPGHHRITAKTARASSNEELDIAEHEVRELTLHLVRNPLEQPVPTASQERSARVPTLAWIAGGVGAAGLVVGGVGGLLAMSAKSSAEDGCQMNRCPPGTWSDLDKAERLATVSTVGFVVGAVGAGIAVGSLLFASDDPPIQANVSLTPTASALSLSGRF